MRYASFAVDGAHTWGVAENGHLYDLGPTGTNVAPTLKSAVEAGLVGTVDHAPRSAPRRAVEEVRFLPVIVAPAKILCVGMNYRSHQDEVGKEAPPAPTIFTRFADSQIGHLDPAVRPHADSQFDYEGELAVVISAPAHRVDAADAWSCVAGYSVYNDFSVRDWQRATTQWTPGKNFPSTGAFGPYLTPAGDVDDVTALRLQTRVNGEVRQSARLEDLIFSIPQVIAHITAFTPLAPGDVIVTGTPGGVGLFMDPPGLLSAGDVVEVEVEGLGTLVNVVEQGQ